MPKSLLIVQVMHHELMVSSWQAFYVFRLRVLFVTYLPEVHVHKLHKRVMHTMLGSRQRICFLKLALRLNQIYDSRRKYLGELRVIAVALIELS